MATSFSVRELDLTSDSEEYIVTNYTCELDDTVIKVKDMDGNILWLQPHNFNPDGSTILSSGNTSIQINTDRIVVEMNDYFKSN